MKQFTTEQETLIAVAVREKADRHLERHGLDDHYRRLEAILDELERPLGTIPIGGIRLEEVRNGHE